MKNRVKKFLSVAFVITLFFLFPFAVTAHSGKTDSSGGHYNHATGEYHYHHGYSAHDHYDMDGDGDLDCPYKFNDKTNHSSTTSGNSGSNISKSEKITFLDIVLVIFAVLILLVGFLCVYPFIHYLIGIFVCFFFEKILRREIKESTAFIITVVIFLAIVTTIALFAILL